MSRQQHKTDPRVVTLWRSALNNSHLFMHSSLMQSIQMSCSGFTISVCIPMLQFSPFIMDNLLLTISLRVNVAHVLHLDTCALNISVESAARNES